MSKDNKTPKENIDYFLYISQFVLLGLAIVFSVVTICVLIYCLYYGLSSYYMSCGFSLLMCGVLFFNYFTFDKFKELRKKYKKGEKQ